jgi:hypothetical protein
VAGGAGGSLGQPVKPRLSSAQGVVDFGLVAGVEPPARRVGGFQPSGLLLTGLVESLDVCEPLEEGLAEGCELVDVKGRVRAVGGEEVVGGREGRLEGGGQASGPAGGSVVAAAELRTGSFMIVALRFQSLLGCLEPPSLASGLVAETPRVVLGSLSGLVGCSGGRGEPHEELLVGPLEDGRIRGRLGLAQGSGGLAEAGVEFGCHPLLLAAQLP